MSTGHDKQHPPKTGFARKIWDLDDEEIAERFGPTFASIEWQEENGYLDDDLEGEPDASSSWRVERRHQGVDQEPNDHQKANEGVARTTPSPKREVVR